MEGYPADDSNRSEDLQLTVGRIEQIVQNFTAEQWMALPELPVELCEDFDGVLQIKERWPRDYDWKIKETKALYEFEPISEKRWSELEAAAFQFAGGAVDTKSFFNQTVDSVAIINNPAIPLDLRHYWGNNITSRMITTVNVLRMIHEDALENLYAAKLVESAKTLLAAHMPDALPKEPTTMIMLANGRSGTGYYYGRFGNMHLISLHPVARITADNITGLQWDDWTVLTTVHELVHQFHAEVSGRPDTSHFNQETLTDVFQVFRLAVAYHEAEAAQEDGHSRLAGKVENMVCETLAATVEEEVRKAIGVRSMFVKGVLATGPELPEARKAIKTLLPNADSVRRHDLFTLLLDIDLAAIADLSDHALRNIIDQPQNILHLKKVTSANQPRERQSPAD